MRDAQERPVVRAIIAYDALPFALVVCKTPMTLERAADFARSGWQVLVDPQDEEDLARYEQMQRALKRG